MHFDRVGFQAFAADMAAHKEDVGVICARFEPFFRIVERGEYALGMPEAALYKEVTGVVRRLLAADDVRVCPFSVSRPYDAPCWMTDAAYVDSIRECLGREAVGSEVLIRIVAGTSDEAARTAAAGVTTALDSAPPWKEFVHGLNEAVAASFRSRAFNDHVIRSIQTGVQDLLRAYLTAALADIQPWGGNLASAVAVLPQAIPFSRRSSATCRNVITLFA